MAITTSLVSAATVASTADATSFSTPSWSPTPNRFVLAFVGYSIASGTTATPTSVTGNGMTWFRHSSSNLGLNGACVFGAYSRWSPTTGPLTFSFGAVTQTSCFIHIVEVAGADMTSGLQIGAGGAVNQPFSVTTDAAVNTASGTFNNVPATSSRCLSFWMIAGAAAASPRASWTELADSTVLTPTGDMETQWRSDASEQTFSVTFAGTFNVRGAGIEVAAAITTPSSVINAHRPAPFKPGNAR